MQACPQGIKIHFSQFQTSAIKKLRQYAYHSKEHNFPNKKAKNYFSMGPTWAQRGPVEKLGPMGQPLRFSLKFPQTLSLAPYKIWLKKPTREFKGKGPKGP